MTENTDVLNKTDEELVLLTLQNNAYYGYLIDRYGNKLLRYIIRISSLTREDAEDILQEVFLKVYQNLNDFDTELKFSSWIYRITHNEAISHIRKALVRPQTVDIESDNLLIKETRHEFNIAQVVDNKRLAEELRKVINQMESKYRDVLILRYLEDKDYKEISDILKKPIGTVATLLSRAKLQLKAEILKHPIIN